jgi:hypothetical protein
VTNRKPKATSSRVRQWDEGEPLSFVWFACASREAKREYQTCKIDSRRMSHRLDMEIQVLDDLISGKLVAWGVREGAPLDEGPTLIPPHLFPRDGDDTAAVDWSTSALRSSGFSFLRIRVMKPPRKRPERKKVARPSRQVTGGEPEQTIPTAPSAGMSNSGDGRQNKPSNARMGRPSKDTQIREILEQMRSEGWDFVHRLQKESCQKIVELAQAKGFDTSKDYSDPVLKRLIREARDE